MPVQCSIIMNLIWLSLIAAAVNSVYGYSLSLNDNSEIFSSESDDGSIVNSNVNSKTDDVAHNFETTSSNVPCRLYYSHVCNTTFDDSLKNYQFEKNMRQLYSSFMPKFMEYLKTEKAHEIKSLLLEHRLYKNCMQLGTVDGSFVNVHNTIDNMYDFIVKKLHQNNYSRHTWLNQDEMLAYLGFGYTFFAIKVMSNPKSPNENIILLEPPIIEDWNAKKLMRLVSSLFKKLQQNNFNLCEDNVNLQSDNYEKNISLESYNETVTPALGTDAKKINLPCESYNKDQGNNISKLNEDALQLFNEAINAVFNTMNVLEAESTYQILSVKSWNEKYYTASGHTSMHINWAKIFNDEFKHLGINIKEDEIIIVKNVPYFLRLAKILQKFSNEAIVHAVKSKFVAENIRYFDWDWAQSIFTIEKSLFCFQETKLYGLSEVLIGLFKEEERIKPYMEMAQRILNNINVVLTFGYLEDSSLDLVKKNYLYSELKAITRDVLKQNINLESVSHYYDDLQVLGDYFIDITNYRRLIKNKENQRLKKTAFSTFDLYGPFSITDLRNARNRFILHTMFSIMAAKPIFQSSIEDRGVYYSTYGVQTAGFLFSLLKEDWFETSNIYHRKEVDWLLPRVNYSPKIINCYVPEDVIKHDYVAVSEIITHFFSLRIAYEASKLDNQTASPRDFFKWYTATQCQERNKKKTPIILSNFKLCLGSEYTYPKCLLAAAF